MYHIKYMTTRTRIREVAEGRGITTAYQLQKAAGLYPSMAARLYADDIEKIAIETIDKLCEALGCQPGDLFVRVSDAPPKKDTPQKIGTAVKKRKK